MDIFVTALFTHELPRLLAKLIYHVSEYANWSHCLCMEMYQDWPNTNRKNFFTSSHKFHTRRLNAALKISLKLVRTKFIQITSKISSNLTKNTLRSIYFGKQSLFIALMTQSVHSVKNVDLPNVKTRGAYNYLLCFKGIIKTLQSWPHHFAV